jgi:hypothetical protein
MSASLFAAIMLIVSGCSLDPDRKFNTAIEHYTEKKPGAASEIEREFINTITIETLEFKNFMANGRLLYRTDDNETEILYPMTLSLSLPGGEGIKHIDANDDYAAITDGYQISVYDGGGSHRQDETIGDKKKPVKDLFIHNDDVIYYKNSKLYRYSIIHNSSDLLLNDTFPPPYTNYYSVCMYKINDLLCILTGIAGSYNFNIINLSSGSVVLKNFNMSSSKHHTSASTLNYIAGNSGNWELVRYDIENKSKKTIAKFTDLIDIECTAIGYIFENKAGLWCAEYGKNPIRVPFRYQLSGRFMGRVILKYGNSYRIVNMQNMFAGLNKLYKSAGELFVDKK